MQLEAKKIVAGVTIILLAGMLGFVVSPFAHDLWSFGIDTFLPKLSRQGTLSLVATLAILCLALGVLLYRSYSKRLLIESARKQGRPVCDCTTTGEIMLVDPKKGGVNLYTYVCPKCGKEFLKRISW